MPPVRVPAAWEYLLQSPLCQPAQASQQGTLHRVFQNRESTCGKPDDDGRAGHPQRRAVGRLAEPGTGHRLASRAASLVQAGTR